MPAGQATTMTKDDPSKEYKCCKGFLVYGGLQRSVGDEPHCLGFKKLLENVTVTEEDVVAPPPDDSSFIFVGVGTSVYNEEMLLRNRLPLVNGFSQLVVSKDTATADELQKEVSKARRRQQEQQEADEARVSGRGVECRWLAGDTGSAAAIMGRGRGRCVPERRLAALERLPRTRLGGGEARMTIGRLLAAGRERVERQALVSLELARVVPGKMRHAARVQVAKAKEMPGMMMHTARSGIDLGASAIEFIESKLAEGKEEEEDGRGAGTGTGARK